MNVTLICCFHGRHYKVERILKCFLNQDYKDGKLELLLYNNSSVPQILDQVELPENKSIKLINNHLDLKTGKEYTNTGDIFRDALTFISEDSIICSHFDSDDIYLPNHVSEGVKRIKEAYRHEQLAYKPYFSYYLHGNNQIKKDNNNFEPSIFIDKQFLIKEGYRTTSASYNQKWLDKLHDIGGIYIPIWGLSTLIYDWSDGHGTHKISGGGDGRGNFIAHRLKETESGDGVLSPCNPEIVQKYYDLVKNQ
mgnify:CR=1 FL=1